MTYLLAIVAAISLASGYGVAYKVYSGEIRAMEIAIEASNIASKQLLERTQADVKKAEEKAAGLNQEIDRANEQNIHTINALDARLDAVRLYPPPKSCRTNSVPKRTSAANAVGQTDNAEFSANFDRTVKAKARIADETANYAQMCWRFVSNKCGLN